MLLGDGRRSSTSTLKGAPDSLKLLFDPPPEPLPLSRTTQQYFSSAVGHNRLQNLRQRGSASGSSTPASRKNDLEDDWEAEWVAMSHSRSITESASYSWTNSGRDPLQGGSFASSSSTVGRAGTTRPHLARLTDQWDASNGVGQEDHAGLSANGRVSSDPSGMEEKEVVVHQVVSTDSLAGVALKYGITLANLRKANHLWPSDPIHLRKVLYIPLDMMSSHFALAFKAKWSDPSNQNGAGLEGPDQDVPEVSSSANSGWQPSPTSTIRRIPASQLSFFPPSSSTNASRNESSIYVSPDIENRSQPIPVFNGHSRSATGPSASLTALLTALPIAASTRDTIIARLSFDSSRSSSVSDDQEHEMDNVRAHGYRGDDPFETPKIPFQEPNRPLRSKTSSVKSSKGKARASPPPSPHGPPVYSRAASLHESRSGYEKESKYDLAAKVQLTSNEPLSGVRQRPATIRTAQMEPSPAMQLPSLSRANSAGTKTRKPTSADYGYELW